MGVLGIDTAKGYIEGKNAVLEALKAGRQIDKLFVAKSENDKSLGFIIAKARERGAVISEVDRRKLDSMSQTHAHQGVIALASEISYFSIEEILHCAAKLSEKPLIVICDEITDPHNLGAIIRSAECAGAHGIIIPKHRSAGITPVVEKSAAGASGHLPIARVTNLVSAIKTLKEAGVWIYGGAASGGTALWDADFSGAAAIVIGSEGSGMSRLVSENCDFIISIPVKGRISSLNASAAASVILFEALRQRGT